MSRKNKKGQTRCPWIVILIVLHFAETVTAVYGPVAAWLERNLSVFAAAGAYSRKHLAALATAPVLVLTGRAAFRAAAGLIGKPFFCKEFLFRYGEHKLTATVTTGQITVLVH